MHFHPRHVLGTTRVCVALIVAASACGRDTPAAPDKTAAPAPEKAPASESAALDRATRDQLELGAERYGRMCAVCHGAHGEGYSADNAPAIAHPGFLGSVSDDFLRRAIANGRTGTTMSAWARARGGPLPPAEIDAVVLHIRTWQKAPPATLDERAVSGDLERGTVLYVRECQRCHGPRGTGGTNIRIGDPQLLTGVTNGFLRSAIGKGRHGTPMPGYAESLGEQGVEDLVAYVRSLESNPTPHEPPLVGRPPPLPMGTMPLNPKGPEPQGFKAHPANTPADVVRAQLKRGARFGILDARAPSDYANMHIAGAASVPFYDPSPYLAQLPKDTWLVCYCACPHAESGILAQKLKENGFTKVTVLDEGLGYWQEKQYPTSTLRAP